MRKERDDELRELTPAASIHYVLKKAEKDEEVVPPGWEEWLVCVKAGSTPWEAAGLPMKLGSRQPDPYPGLRVYHGELGAVTWAGYYQHFRDQAAENGWTALQMGVVLCTVMRGQAQQVVKSQLGTYNRYNIYKLIKVLVGWGSTPEEVTRECRDIFHKRRQARGESINEFACELLFLADMSWPEDHEVERRDQALLKQFTRGLTRKEVRSQLTSWKELGQVTSLQAAVKVANVAMKPYLEVEEQRDGVSEALRVELMQARKVANGLLPVDTSRAGGYEEVYEVNMVQTRPQQKEKAMTPVKEAAPPEGRYRTQGKSPRRQGCFNCGESGHWKSECPLKQRRCYNCQEAGHIAAKCPKKGNSASRGEQQQKAAPKEAEAPPRR